jgi:hypothetical protein
MIFFFNKSSLLVADQPANRSQGFRKNLSVKSKSNENKNPFGDKGISITFEPVIEEPCSFWKTSHSNP